jgi:hypothetical protein
MADLRIFSYLPNPRVWKATIAARFCGVGVEVRGASGKELRDRLWDYDARPLAQGERGSLSSLARTGRVGLTGAQLFKTDAFLEAQPFGNRWGVHRETVAKPLARFCERMHATIVDPTHAQTARRVGYASQTTAKRLQSGRHQSRAAADCHGGRCAAHSVIASAAGQGLESRTRAGPEGRAHRHDSNV